MPFSCFLFRPRKSREKRRKRSHTKVSNASVTRTSRLSQTLLQTPLPCFHASINEYYTAKNGLGTIAPRLLSQVKVGTHLGSLRKIAHSGSQGETGVLWMEALSLPSDRFARSGNPAWPEGRTAYFAALGSWPGGAPKERREPSGQRCAYARRCPEASRPRWAARLFYFCLNCGLYALRSGPFRVCETRGGITTLGVLCVLPKRRTSACQSDSFVVF